MPSISRKSFWPSGLREVRALVGFTRIESPSDYDNPAAFPETRESDFLVPNRPGSRPRRFAAKGCSSISRKTLIQKWVKKTKALDGVFLEAHQRWRIARKLDPPHEFYPGIRFVLLHSFAHALIRQLAVECGYTTASLRERIYSRNPGEDQPEMAGVLIYTAAPDSEGTLGGLVSLGKPETLERHLDQALDNMRLCASDPLCAEHHPEGWQHVARRLVPRLPVRPGNFVRAGQQISGSSRVGLDGRVRAIMAFFE